jgi:hypothetical protein
MLLPQAEVAFCSGDRYMIGHPIDGRLPRIGETTLSKTISFLRIS